MKAEELMIGDWVLYPNKTPQQIFGIAPEITADGATEDGFFNGCEWYPLKDAKPIPITPEILKKNGFGYIKHDGEELTHFYPGEPQFCRDMDLHIGTDNKGHYWLNYRANDIYGLHSVHELQHALRLCRIEKEIVL